jgi:hypothetical protein
MQAGKLVVVLALTFLVGCAMADEMVLPDGTKGYNISCDGTVLSMGNCYKKAGEICPRGYDVLAQGGEANPIGSSFGQLSGTPSYVQGGYVTQYGMVVTRDLYVRCK